MLVSRDSLAYFALSKPPGKGVKSSITSQKGHRDTKKKQNPYENQSLKSWLVNGTSYHNLKKRQGGTT